MIELLPNAQSSIRNKNFVSTSQILVKSRNWTFSLLRFFTWKLEFFSNILCMIVKWRFFVKILNDSFPKITPLQIFKWVESHLQVSGEGFKILRSFLFPIYKLSQDNTEPENICDIVFEKMKVFKKRKVPVGQ